MYISSKKYKDKNEIKDSVAGAGIGIACERAEKYANILEQKFNDVVLFLQRREDAAEAEIRDHRVSQWTEKYANILEQKFDDAVLFLQRREEAAETEIRDHRFSWAEVDASFLKKFEGDQAEIMRCILRCISQKAKSHTARFEAEMGYYFRQVKEGSVESSVDEEKIMAHKIMAHAYQRTKKYVSVLKQEFEDAAILFQTEKYAAEAEIRDRNVFQQKKDSIAYFKAVIESYLQKAEKNGVSEEEIRAHLSQKWELYVGCFETKIKRYFWRAEAKEEEAVQISPQVALEIMEINKYYNIYAVTCAHTVTYAIIQQTAAMCHLMCHLMCHQKKPGGEEKQEQMRSDVIKRPNKEDSKKNIER